MKNKWFIVPDDVEFLADGVVYPDFDPDSLLVLCASSSSSKYFGHLCLASLKQIVAPEFDILTYKLTISHLDIL